MSHSLQYCIACNALLAIGDDGMWPRCGCGAHLMLDTRLARNRLTKWDLDNVFVESGISCKGFALPGAEAQLLGDESAT